MNIRTFRPILAALPLLFLAVGCAQSQLFQSPTAQIKSMSVGEVTPDGMTMNFNVAVTNPNPLALPVDTADYKLTVDKVDLVDGVTPQSPGALPANGTGNVTLPVKVQFNDLLKAKNAIAAGGGDVAYNLAAGLAFNPEGISHLLGTRAVRVPLNWEGTLHLRDILQQNLDQLARSPAAQELMASIASGQMGSTLGSFLHK